MLDTGLQHGEFWFNLDYMDNTAPCERITTGKHAESI